LILCEFLFCVHVSVPVAFLIYRKLPKLSKIYPSLQKMPDPKHNTGFGNL